MSSPRIKPHHYIAYGSYRAFEIVLKLFPMEVVCLVGAVLGNIAWLLLPGRKRTVIRNLRIAFGQEKSLTEIKKLCRECFQTTGSNMIASIRAVSLSDEEIAQRVQIEGADIITNILNRGEGFIGLLAHMGNWEMLAQLSRTDPNVPPFGGLYRPLDNPLMDKLIKRRRQKSGAKLFSRRDGFFKPTAHLKEGNPLGIFADQRAGKQGVAVPLFNKLTSMTNLPAILHKRTKAEVIPISCNTTSLGHWRVIVHDPIKRQSSEKLTTKNFVLDTAKAYEAMFKDYPADVLWMHQYWRISPRCPLATSGIQCKPPLKYDNNKPLKLLLYTGEIQANDTDAVSQIKRIHAFQTDIEITTIGQFKLDPSASHHIQYDPHAPPHLARNAIRKYDLDSPLPLDFAIDISEYASGAKQILAAGIPQVFCRRGKWVSKNTRNLFAEKQKNSIQLFLTSLGIDDDLQSST